MIDEIKKAEINSHMNKRIWFFTRNTLMKMCAVSLIGKRERWL